MKKQILFIEDNKAKAEDIRIFINQNFSSLDIVVRESFTAGLRELFTNNYSILFLDMSLPTREGLSSSSINTFEQLGGHKILSEMKRKKFPIPTIVISMFSEFGVGESFMNLNEFDEMFTEKFPDFYMGSVYYSARQEEKWKSDLRKILQTLV